jgi:CRP-like cAMP-binding protein
MTKVSRQEKKFGKGDVVIEEGTPATEEIYYLHRGTCAAEVKGKIVGQIESGEFFGEVASILQTDRSATVRAATDCTVYIFGGLQDHSLYDLLNADPSIMRKLFEQMALRLVESSHRHAGDAEKLTALAHRYRSTISGALFAISKLRHKDPSPTLEELENFLRYTSGVAEGRSQDMDPRYFPRSKSLLS